MADNETPATNTGITDPVPVDTPDNGGEAPATPTPPVATPPGNAEGGNVDSAKPALETPDELKGSVLDDGVNEPEKAPQSTAPEAYQPFDIDGKAFPEDQLSGFATAARELGLSQENAQKILSTVVPTAREYLVKDLAVKTKEWASLTAKDPEIGGANFEANKGIAKQAYAHFTTPELRAILTGSGLGNHPEVVRLFYRIGKTMQQDSGVTGGASAPAGVRRRYPNSNMVVDE